MNKKKAKFKVGQVVAVKKVDRYDTNGQRYHKIVDVGWFWLGRGSWGYTLECNENRGITNWEKGLRELTKEERGAR